MMQQRSARDHAAEMLGPRELERLIEARRESAALRHEASESYAMLWVAVIEKAMLDLAFLRDKCDQAELKPHEAKRLERIREYDPVSFFSDPWFRTICDGIGVPADVVRPAGLAADAAMRRAAP